MNSVRSTVDTSTLGNPVRSAREVRRALDVADTQSYDVVTRIQSSGFIHASHPAGDVNILACVSLSECNLPSLISHAERYGRFGFVFSKTDIFSQGGRPCAYLERKHRNLVIDSCRKAARTNSPSANDWEQFASLCQIHSPIRSQGRRIQDFTHEREWRIFKDIDLSVLIPLTILAPHKYLSAVRGLFPAVNHLVSIDDLFEWGA